MKSSLLALCLLTMLMGGCVRVDIGDTVPTVGEELIQLEQARQLGALSEEEFRQLRLAVVSRI